MENQTIWIIIIASNILIYGLCCFLIYKRKQFSGISVRSPMLLLCTNISNFAMSMIILLHKLFESNILSIFYYLFRLMMMIAFFLRYERILTCFKYNSDKFNIKLNIEKFAEKRYLLQEKYYVKIYIGLCLIICITLLIGWSLFKICSLKFLIYSLTLFLDSLYLYPASLSLSN